MDYKSFRHLLKRYLDGSCREDEKRLVDQWYELLDKEEEALAVTDAEEVEKRLWDKIQNANAAGAYMPQARKKLFWRKAAIAASVTALLGLGGLWWALHTRWGSATHLSIVAEVRKGFLQQTNTSDTIAAITLEDSSVVTVYPGATLAYPEHFESGKREVYLEGEAFFSISRNPGKPFRVYSNHIITQVLGTSFGIRSENGQTEVAVKTGKVAVYENKSELKPGGLQPRSDGVIITPNQRVTYYEAERHFVTSVVEQPLPVPDYTHVLSGSTRFNYNETPLANVINDLEKAYELEIELENETLKNCPFTGDLSGQNLFDQLEGISLVFGATYEIKGIKILLKGGKNCNY